MIITYLGAYLGWTGTYFSYHDLSDSGRFSMSRTDSEVDSSIQDELWFTSACFGRECS